MFPRNFNTPHRLRAYVAAAAVSVLALPALAGSIKDLPSNPEMRSAVQSVTSKKLMDAPGGKFNGDKPVTRFELAVTLDRLVRYIENGRKPLHPTTRPHAAALPSNATGQVRAALKHLTDYDFIPDNSILLKGTGREVVTANQLSTTLAQVTIRLSDRAEAPQSNL